MRKTLTLLFMMFTLLTSAQSLTDGYYRIEVVRSGGIVYCENETVWQDMDYTAPASYSLADLPYIFKFEFLDNSFFKIKNCKSLKYVSLPANSNQFSTQLLTSNDGAIFSYEITEDGRYYGFYTYAKFLFADKEYEQIGYLNDFDMGNARALCLWTDGPSWDDGSKFNIVPVDADEVEQLMAGTTPDKQDMATFTPENGTTYTMYSRNTNGYVAGHGDVTSTVTADCEYSFERAGSTSDQLPTYYIKQVSSGKYLQKVDLSYVDDSSDLQLGLPHGDKSTAATFTVLKALKDTDDPRATCANFIDGEYVICCSEPYYSYTLGETTYYYVESWSNMMFYATYDDGSQRAFRIDRYESRGITPPTVEVEAGDDQSVELWGAATDTIAVRTAEGLVVLIPDNMIESRNGGTITLKGGEVTVTGTIVETPKVDANFPKFRTFKFNNKYNDVLVADIEGVVADDEVTLDVTGCIAKTMCPSFSLSDEDATVYYKGVRQVSHQNRNRFDKALTYTIAKPGHRIMQVVKTQDEVWSTPTQAGGETQINLTADQLSTNAPSNYDEDVDCLVDGNLDNYYHSTWGRGSYMTYQPLTYDTENPNNTVWPYVDIHLNSPLRHIKWGYTTQNYGSNRLPVAIKLQASNNGTAWTDIVELTDLPQSYGTTYMTDAIDLGRNYSYLRVLLTATNHKNYLCMAEMYLYKVETEGVGGEPELLQPAQYSYSQRPWGRDVQVTATFATDRTPMVPRVDINLDNGVTTYDIHHNKTTYFSGRITIDGAGVFPDLPETEVNMRGRGNSSWSASKKPYRLKFNTKQKPFGLKKGKSWCLIAQAQTGSMLTNPIALRIASMTGAVAANHAIPVELYVNGSYLGSYMFTENPGFANNSIDIDETNAAYLELDSYYDETYKFRDSYYQLPVNIKEPELAEMTDYTEISNIKSAIQTHFNKFTRFVSNANAPAYEALTDIDSWSRFMLVNDVVRNTELMHPKSTKLFRLDINDTDDKYVWGPVWDFDWAFGYQNSYSYCINSAETDFYDAISHNNTGGTQGRFFSDMLSNSEVLQADRYRVWTEFMQTYRDELIDYVDDYLTFAQPSFTNNSTKWSDGKNYKTNAENAKAWLKKRTDWVYRNMPVYELPAVTYGLGDVNEDGRVSVGDAICVVNRILGLPNDIFNATNADMNGDGRFTVGDVQLIIRAILDAENAAQSTLARLPYTTAELSVMPFTATSGAEVEVDVNMITEELTAGMQMDVVLPAGAILTNVRTRDDLSPFRSRISDLGGGRYRVLLLSQTGERIIASDQNNMVLDVTMGALPTDKAERIIRLTNVIFSSPEGTDLAASGARGMFAEATGIADVTADDITVRGGDDLRIESVKDGTVDVYNLAGQLVRRVTVTRGTTTVNLPYGIYIVSGNKIMID